MKVIEVKWRKRDEADIHRLLFGENVLGYVGRCEDRGCFWVTDVVPYRNGFTLTLKEAKTAAENALGVKEAEK